VPGGPPWHGSAAGRRGVLATGSDGRRVHTIREPCTAWAALDSDVLVCGDDADAKATLGGLIEDIPDLRWVDCGALSSARIAETLTALLISVNRAYRVRDAGFRIVGRDRWGDPRS
jgi:hypothetical protein